MEIKLIDGSEEPVIENDSKDLYYQILRNQIVYGRALVKAANGNICMVTDAGVSILQQAVETLTIYEVE